MNIQMIGIDHTTAPVEIREKFSFTTKVQTALMEQAAALPGVLGVILLSTCNRTELWVHCRPDAEPPLCDCICQIAGTGTEQYRDRFRSRRGEEAVAYLFGMTSGLRSQIFGEDQILTQVKEALDRARTALHTDTVLEVLFRMAITAAKKVKTGMQTATADTGAVGYCLEKLRGEGYDFMGRRCLVIGNGKMGKLAAQALRQAGAHVTVTVRQYRSGVVEIPVGCERIDYGRRMELLPDCDMVVSATTSPNTTMKYQDVSAAVWKPGLIFLDLAVPRDIDPRIAELPGVRLFDIDSFHAPQSEERTRMEEEAQVVLAQQIQEFLTWYDCRDRIPMTNELAEKCAVDFLVRVEPAIRQTHLDSEAASALRVQLEDAAKKQFRRLLFAVRDEAGAAAFRQCLDAMEKFYDQA